MIFSSSPYFPLVKRLRRLMGDEENPAAAFTLSAVGPTSVVATISFVAPTNLAPASQTLTLSGGQGVTPVTIDLSQVNSIRELLLSLDGTVVGQSTLSAVYNNNPLRTNSPLDLVPGAFALNAAPRTFYTRHYLSDDDLVDDLNGALAQHNQAYTFDPMLATATVPLPSGQVGYPYPDQSAYPYPSLASKIIYLCPPSEAYIVCLLAAAFGLVSIANRYSRIPLIITEDATIDRGVAVDRLMELAQQLKSEYQSAVDQAGLNFEISDLTRISSRTGILSQTPELNTGLANNIYGMRWLTASVPNTAQPVTQQDAHAYDNGILSEFISTPDIGFRQ